jgi:gliding motility-associated-like protein
MTSLQRPVVVAALPTVQLPDELTGWRGSTQTLRPELSGDPVRFAWSPPDFLISPATANTSVVGLDTDTTYTLRVTNAFGCSASAPVRIRLQQRIWVPDAFTPNGDGTNDSWELRGLDAYPRADLRVYDRWGTLVYRATRPDAPPFDGTYRGEGLPAGTYAYVLYPAPDRPPLRGVVVIAR